MGDLHCARTYSPRVLACARAVQTTTVSSHEQRRTFLDSLAPKVQTLTATRTVPYSSKTIYAAVSDVSSYKSFLPFCQSSTVTRTSSPDSNGKTWPEEAELTVGYNSGLSETFTSRVYCDGSRTVEAVSGDARTSLSDDCITHHSARDENDAASKGNVLTHLLTRWTLSDFPFKPPTTHGDPRQDSSEHPSQDMTQVSLAIEYRFANPVYATMSAAAAPKVAEYMIKAFEERVKAIAGAPPADEKLPSGVKDPSVSRLGTESP